MSSANENTEATSTNEFLEKLDKKEMCLFVDPMDCIKQGKRKNQEISLNTEWASDDTDGTNTCCEEVPLGTCGDGKEGDTWRKEYCWSLGRDWKGGTITDDGLDCCKPMDTNLTCKDWDWTKCWTVVGDRGQYTKELAKIPDPRYGYPYRDENPLLLCDDGDNCKGGSFFLQIATRTAMTATGTVLPQLCVKISQRVRGEHVDSGIKSGLHSIKISKLISRTPMI